MFDDGGLIDECGDWETATDQDRDAAFRAALTHIMANKQAMRAMGLDVDAIELFYT